MKKGIVVHIRLNPEDVMGVIDVVKKADAYIPGMSLAQVTRLALSGLLEAARKHETIPRREGFEYSEMANPFLTDARQGRKLQISSIVETAEAARAAIDKPATPVDISFQSTRPNSGTQGENDLFDELAARKARYLIRSQELSFRRTADPLNFSPQDQMELDEVDKNIQELDEKMGELHL